ncbi:DUF637 domain-containing protein [Acinetobacter bereziniae]|uniref:DUF637 domain-containing protein n=1 Tax=Acinetobacter bereziniae TaxID=106648 RepID=UPI00125008D9
MLSTRGTITNTALLILTTQTSISLFNNGGDISAAIKELRSKESVKSLATSIVTVGLIQRV